MKRMLFLIGLLVLIVALGLWQVSKARTFQFFGELVARMDRADAVVALTFDDGPTPQYTEEVLALLAARDVKATFFVTGREAETNFAQTSQIVAAGHELGNHSYSHPSLLLKSPARIRDEIERTDAVIRRTGQQSPIYFRPPFGKKLFILPWYLAQTERTTIMWDVEPESYAEVAQKANLIAAHVLERVQPGSIVLLHLMYDSRVESRKALPLIIDGLRARGYQFVTISELLRKNGA